MLNGTISKFQSEFGAVDIEFPSALGHAMTLFSVRKQLNPKSDCRNLNFVGNQTVFDIYSHILFLSFIHKSNIYDFIDTNLEK